MDALADPLDAGFGFDLIRLEACLAEKTHAAEASFDNNENARWQVGFLMDRLSARFGEHRVLRFVPQDTHIPEAAKRGGPRTGPRLRRRPGHANGGAAIRRCRPLRLLAEAGRNQRSVSPWRLTARRNSFAGDSAQYDVVRAEGPERIAMEWWKENLHQRLIPGSEQKRRIKLGVAPKPLPPSRDYFRVETRQGQRFWLYRDGLYQQNGLAPRWYLHGVFA